MWTVASFADRIRRYVSSPQGQKVIREGQKQLAKPENQRRLQQLGKRLRRSR